MSGQDMPEGFPERIPTRPAVFTPAIDKLIKEIWELGGMDELRLRIDALKQLPPAEFEAQLTVICNRLRERR